MGRRRRERSAPGKMTDFFSMSDRRSSQNGAGSVQGSAHTHGLKHPRSQITGASLSPSSDQPPPKSQTSSTTNSPAKAKQRLAEVMAEGEGGVRIDDTIEFQDAIAAFPTNNQPVMDSMLKDMLVSLRGAIHTDMLQLVNQCKAEVTEVRDRVTHIEDKMGDFAETFNTMVDAHNDHEEDIVWLKAKVADLEDRSRRNNIKIRGIPESVKNSDLNAFLANILKEALPDLPPEDFIIDRIHRLPKPKHIPEKLPRDTIARIHYFTVKEKLMYVTRRADNLPECMQGLSFFADLSAHTMQRRRNLMTITKPLRNHRIPYRWNYPANLLITKDEKEFLVRTLEEGIKLLERWKILPDESEGDKQSHTSYHTRTK